MSNKKYPRIGSSSKGLNRYNKKHCAVCNELATHRIDVQWNIFRGDDEVYSVCEDHKSATLEQLGIES